jgi:uncharacterized membrane protein
LGDLFDFLYDFIAPWSLRLAHSTIERPNERKPAVIPIMTVSRFRTFLYTAVAVVAIVGLADATYLTVQALTGETLSCGGSPDCSRVLGSSYSKLGGIPVAMLGALAYFTVFTCATFAAFGYARAPKLLILVAVAMFLATLWFLYVQAFLLHAYCRYCLFSAALTFLIAGLLIAVPPPQRSAGG